MKSALYMKLGKVPKLIRVLCKNYNAWIVGSAVKHILSVPTKPTEKLRDIDVIVPLRYWNDAVFLLPKDAKINSFGGFKFKTDGIECDVWCQDLSDYVLLPGNFDRAALNIYSWKHVTIGDLVKKD